MSKEDQPVAVFCPHCGKSMYRYAMTLFNKNVGAPSKIDYDWRCPVCVYTYPEFWLKDERINHFPYLLFGYGSDKKEILRIAKLVQLNEQEIKNSGLEFYQWFKINKDKSIKNTSTPKEVKEVIDDLKLNDDDIITIGFETKTVKEWDQQVLNAQESNSSMPKNEKKEELPGGVKDQISSPPGNF